MLGGSVDNRCNVENCSCVGCRDVAQAFSEQRDLVAGGFHFLLFLIYLFLCARRSYYVCLCFLLLLVRLCNAFNSLTFWYIFGLMVPFYDDCAETSSQGFFLGTALDSLGKFSFNLSGMILLFGIWSTCPDSMRFCNSANVKMRESSPP